MKNFTYLLLLICLSSCATGPLDATGTFLPPAHTQKLLSSNLCCATYKNFQYNKLTKNQEIKVAITPKSPVFEFNQGRSFFSAFELPNEVTKSLTVKTEPVNMLWNRTGHVLIPAIIFLDNQFNVIEISNPNYEARSPKVIGGSWAEAAISIPVSAKYVVLIDGKSSDGLAWRDSDQPSGLLFVRSGPTGEVSLLAN
jgi:maltose operon periplasmic protein